MPQTQGRTQQRPLPRCSGICTPRPDRTRHRGVRVAQMPSTRCVRRWACRIIGQSIRPTPLHKAPVNPRMRLHRAWGAPPTAPAPVSTAPGARSPELQKLIDELEQNKKWLANQTGKGEREQRGFIEARIKELTQEIINFSTTPDEIRDILDIGPTTGTPATGGDQGETPPGYELVPGTGELQMGEFEESPGYQFTLKEGLNAQQNALSAMGQNRSGKHLKASAQYAEGLASTEYDNFLRRWYDTLKPLQSMAGMGQTSAQATGAAGANAAGNMGNAYMAGGQASGAGSINQANALTGAIQGGANQYLMYNQLRNLPQYQPFQSGTPNTTGRAVDQWQY